MYGFINLPSHVLNHLTAVDELLAVRHMKVLYESLVFRTVRDGISFITHPLIHIGPDSILIYPNLGENATKLTPRICLRTSEFDLNIILLRCDRLHTPFLELLLREEAKLLLLSIRSARLGGVNA